MMNPEPWIEWIERAKQGDPDSRNRLAELAAERLRNHLFRMTLRHDITEDLVQETVLEMMKILGKLKQSERFLPWIYGIALNKLRSFRRTESKHHNPRELPQRVGSHSTDKDGLEQLIGNELRQVVTQAMQSISERHRTILSLRCYEDMSYSEIAQVLGCSEFAAQMLFVRAKRSLAKELGRYGMGKGALVMALIVFGKMTASTPAAVLRISIPAATMKVGLLAAIAGLATTKTAIVALTTGAVATVGTVVYPPLSQLVWRQEVAPLVQTTASVDGALGMEEGDESRWMYFPEGVGGPVMVRTVRTGTTNGDSLSLQNAIANYHYQPGARQVTIDNWRSYRKDLSATILPGDSPQVISLLSGNSTAGRTAALAGHRFSTSQRGVLVIEDSQIGQKRSTIEQHLNLLEEEYFQSNWPESAVRIDRRDEAHKQGWTQFNITGQINRRGVLGVGQIPFVYSASKRFRPWLDLKIGDDRFIDSAVGCEWIGANGRVERYPSGRLFEGLMRPWMGLHVIDTVRRDAAFRGMACETRRLDEDHVQITTRKDSLEIRYTISLSGDWIESIDLDRDGIHGTLKFSYPAIGLERKTEPVLIPSAYHHDQFDEWWLTTLFE